VDILDLSRGLSVEVDELLASWGASSLFVVGSQSSKEGVGSSTDAIGVIDGLGLVGGMVLLIEVGESLDKAVGDTVLLVELDSTLDGLVTDNVAVGKVFSNDAASWLLLLGDLVAITLSLILVVAAIIFVAASGAGDLNLSSAELGIVEEQGSLGRGFLLEGYGRILSGLSFGDVEAGDLAAV
jgi:hypothetical protein